MAEEQQEQAQPDPGKELTQLLSHARSAVSLLKTAEEKIAEITTAKDSADAIVTELTETRTAAKAKLSEAESELSSLHNMVQDLATKAKEATTHHGTINTALAKVQDLEGSVDQILAQAKQSYNQLTALVETANEKDNAVEQYKKELQEIKKQHNEEQATLRDQYKGLKSKIETLLPGATSVKLASAFQNRKDDVGKNKGWWLALFIGSVLTFIVVGVYVLVYNDDIKTFSDLIFYTLKRSPILAGIIVLEEFARRNYSRKLRMEEDYGYKEVLSRSFDGYKDLMKGIKTEGDTLDSELSRNWLIAMFKNPGRLIDKESDFQKPTADKVERTGT